MRHIKLAAAFVCALGMCWAVAPSLAAPPAGARQKARAVPHRGGRAGRAAPAVNRCVALEQSTEGQKLELMLKNGCGQELSCNVGWSVRCGRSAARRDGETFGLVENERRTVTASAADCGNDSWQIGDIRWSCKHP